MRRALCAAIAVGLLAAGCRTVTPPAVPLSPDDPRPAALLAGLRARTASLQALRGVAKLAVDGPGGSLRSKQVLVAARPARLRVEILGFLSQTVALLATDGDTYELFRVNERSFERGPVRPDLLWEVAGIALAPAQAVRVLLGAPELAGLATAGGLALSDGGVGVLLVDGEGRPRRRLEFDANGDLRRIRAWDAAGQPGWDARYDDFAPEDDTPFAHTLEIDFPTTRVEARIELSHVALNPSLPPGTFELHPPAGLASAGADR